MKKITTTERTNCSGVEENCTRNVFDKYRSLIWPDMYSVDH